MNNPDKNARTTPLGRAEMVRRIVEEGRPVAEVAAGFGVSERTARKWLARFKEQGTAGLRNRSSRPKTVANRTLEPWIDLMERLRREYRLTAEEIAAKLKLARSTVAAWRKRRGLGLLKSLETAAPVVRYQRQRPGELRHLDVKKLARFERIGHRITAAAPAAARMSATTSSMWRSTTPQGSPMSRCFPTSGAPPPPASWSERFAGSGRAASRSSG